MTAMKLIGESLITPNYTDSVNSSLSTPTQNFGHTPTGETPQGFKQEKVTTNFSQILSLVIDKILKVVVFIFGPPGQLRPSPSYTNEVLPNNNSDALFKLITPLKEEITIHITSATMDTPGPYWDRFATNNKKDDEYVAHCGTIHSLNPKRTKRLVDENFSSIPEIFKQNTYCHTEIVGNQVRYYLVVPESRKNSYSLNLPSCHGV